MFEPNIFLSAAIIAVFYGYYMLFLQKSTCFKSLRVYFWAGMMLAIFLAFIDTSASFYISTASPLPIKIIKPVSGFFSSAELTGANHFNFSTWVPFIYFTGGGLMLLKFILDWLSILHLYSRYPKKKMQELVIIEVDEQYAPFSFFSWIFIPRHKFTEEEYKQILLHESIHAKQWHTLDILTAKLMLIMQWFNPFAWLYVLRVQQNLEFLTDRETASKLEDLATYQYLILKTGLSKIPYSITNSFHQSQLKKRIMMLQNLKTKRGQHWKFLLLIPVLAGLIYSFNTVETLHRMQNETIFSTLRPNKATEKGYLKYKGDVYLYVIRNHQCHFYNKWGEEIKPPLAVNLLEALKKQTGKENLHLAPVASRENASSPKRTGYVSLNHQTYFYVMKDGEYIFYDQYGKEVQKNLAEQLFRKLQSK